MIAVSISERLNQNSNARQWSNAVLINHNIIIIFFNISLYNIDSSDTQTVKSKVTV